MKILFIAPNLPQFPYNGFDLITFNTLKELSKRHLVHFVSFCDREYCIKHIEKYCEEIHVIVKSNNNLRWLKQIFSLFYKNPFRVQIFYDKNMHALIKRVLSKENFDVIHVMWFVMAQYIDSMRSDIKKVLAPPDALSLFLNRLKEKEKNIIKKIYFSFQEKKMIKYEGDIYSQYDSCYFVSPIDSLAVLKNNPHINASVIPNGIDTKHYKPLYSDSKAQYPSLVFTGMMSYPPNVDAMIFFTKEILPYLIRIYKDIKFYIVGKDPTEEVKKISSDNIIITGTVNDIIPYLEKATIYVCPLRIGIGFKNKILEAMAMGKAIVATSLSCDGIDVLNNENILLSDSPKEMIESIVKLLEDENLRLKLGINARLTAEKYTWENTGRLLEEVYSNFNPNLA